MRKSKLHIIRLLAVSTVVLLSSCKEKVSKTEEKKPNIIIYLTDDLGYGDLGCYGSPIIKTPEIDKFASQGVLLTDCHSAGTVCSPSRAGLLTGRNPVQKWVLLYTRRLWGLLKEG